jgi:lipopolysaccharide export system permease protein
MTIYLIRDILFSFLVAFLFFFFIFFVNQLLLLAGDILSKQVPFFQVALLVLYTLPGVISMSSPFASLVGTLMTVGRLSSDNEVLVMLSSGLSYRTIIIPAIAIGIFISIVSFFVNDVLLPAGTIKFNNLYRDLMASTPALELAANSVKRFRDTVIVTGPVSGRSIENVLILDRTSDGERRVIMAQAAKLIDDGQEGLSLDLKDAFVQSAKETVRDNYDYASADFLRYWVPQEDMLQSINSIGPREMSSVDLKKSIEEKTIDIGARLEDRYNRVMIQSMSLENTLRNGQGNNSWNRRENFFNALVREHQTVVSLHKDRTLMIYLVEYYKKFTVPFGAFSFVFLAVPLGLFAKKSGQTVGFIFGLIISLIYWTLLIGGQTWGSRLGYSPFWSMWTPNILAGGIGLVLCFVRLRK